MTKEEIISQGHLVGYLTGDLSETELGEVEGFIDSDADVRMEYLSVQRMVESLALTYGLTPREVVKQGLMENPAVMGTYQPVEIGGGGKWLQAASALIALGSALFALYFWNQWKETDNRLAQLTARNIELAESYHTVNRELTSVREDLAVLVSPEFSRIILDGTDNAPGAKAVIYWNPAEEEVFINSANLAALPQNQQYQLWALIDGQPVDAGVFDASEGTFQIMKGVAQADAFAVTVEQSGGSASPTLSTMQVYGAI